MSSILRTLKHLFKGDITWFRVMSALTQGTAMPTDIVAAAALQKGAQFAQQIEKLLEYAPKPTIVLPLIWIKKMLNVPVDKCTELDAMISSVVDYGEKLLRYDELYKKLSALLQMMGSSAEAQQYLQSLPEYQELVELAQKLRPPPFLDQFARRIMGVLDRLSWIHLKGFARTYYLIKKFAEALTTYIQSIGIQEEISPKSLIYWIVFLDDVIDKTRRLLGDRAKNLDDLTLLKVAVLSELMQEPEAAYMSRDDLETAASVIATAIYLLYLIETGRLISASKFIAEHEEVLKTALGNEVVEYAKKVIRDLATFALRDIYFK